jgi:hypothetical protein
LKFATDHKFPKRYVEILKDISAHSDDEYYPPKGFYVVKKLPFRSDAADRFIRRLDQVMHETNKANGGRPQGRIRVRVKNPGLTIYPKAPKGLPIDFYNPTWFNEKLPAQRRVIADVENVTFLPNPDLSFKPNQPDEKLNSKKFSEKHWEKATTAYDLDFLIENKSDSEPDNHNDDSDYGGSIDLEAESSSDDEEEEDEYEEEEQPKDKGKTKAASVDENYEEFDEDEEMQVAGVSGGMTADEWNDWQ